MEDLEPFLIPDVGMSKCFLEVSQFVAANLLGLIQGELHDAIEPFQERICDHSHLFALKLRILKPSLSAAQCNHEFGQLE